MSMKHQRKATLRGLHSVISSQQSLHACLVTRSMAQNMLENLLKRHQDANEEGLVPLGIHISIDVLVYIATI